VCCCAVLPRSRLCGTRFRPVQPSSNRMARVARSVAYCGNRLPKRVLFVIEGDTSVTFVISPPIGFPCVAHHLCQDHPQTSVNGDLRSQLGFTTAARFFARG
jgi:hypothetical protein